MGEERQYMYIRTVILYIIREDLLQDTPELLSVEVRKPRNKPVLISTWYSPPSAKIELFQKFENFLKLIDNEDKDTIKILEAGVVDLAWD